MLEGDDDEAISIIKVGMKKLTEKAGVDPIDLLKLMNKAGVKWDDDDEDDFEYEDKAAPSPSFSN